MSAKSGSPLNISVPMTGGTSSASSGVSVGAKTLGSGGQDNTFSTLIKWSVIGVVAIATIAAFRR